VAEENSTKGKRGRRPRGDPHIVRSPNYPDAAWNEKTKSWRTLKPHEYHLGVRIGAVREEALDEGTRFDEAIELFAREHRHIRILEAKATTPLTDVAHERIHREAQRLALKEWNRLQKNGGTWLTRRPMARKGGRPPAPPGLLDEYRLLLEGRPTLSRRSAARLLAERHDKSPASIEARLRRLEKNATKPSR
jgi:hypothetical protein